MKPIRKRFIESEYAPEDTNVIWVKLVNGKENPNNMQIEDMLQFVNGEWKSIIPKGEGEGSVFAPILKKDSTKIQILKAQPMFSAFNYGLPFIATVSPQRNMLNHRLKSLIKEVIKPTYYRGKLILLYLDEDLNWRNADFNLPDENTEVTTELPIRYIAMITYDQTTSDTVPVPLYTEDWPEGFDDIRADWDEVE